KLLHSYGSLLVDRLQAAPGKQLPVDKFVASPKQPLRFVQCLDEAIKTVRLEVTHTPQSAGHLFADWSCLTRWQCQVKGLQRPKQLVDLRLRIAGVKRDQAQRSNEIPFKRPISHFWRLTNEATRRRANGASLSLHSESPRPRAPAPFSASYRP